MCRVDFTSVETAIVRIVASVGRVVRPSRAAESEGWENEYSK